MILTNNVLCLLRNTPAKLQKYLIFKDIFRKNIVSDGNFVVFCKKIVMKSNNRFSLVPVAIAMEATINSLSIACSSGIGGCRCCQRYIELFSKKSNIPFIRMPLSL